MKKQIKKNQNPKRKGIISKGLFFITYTINLILARDSENIVRRSYNITKDEDFYFNFIEAFIENSDKNLQVDYSWQPTKNYYYEILNITEKKIPFEKPPSIEEKDLKDYGILGSALVSTGLWWFSKMMYYNTKNNNKFIEFGDIKRFKSHDLENPKTLYTMDFKKENFLCEKFYYLTELQMSLFICKSNDNRWYTLLKCADQSCNDRTQILKISENRRDKSSAIKLKIMPGYSKMSVTIFVYFSNDLLLETINIDKEGGYNSEIHILEQKLRKVFYFSGQLIVFKCFTPVVGVYDYYYSIHDFGSKYDFNGWKKMENFGKFLNSYSTREGSDLMIEFYDSTYNVIALKYDRNTKQFLIESSIDMKNEKNFNNETYTYIFEIAEFQFIMNANVNESDPSKSKIYYSLGYKGQNMVLTDYKNEFFYTEFFDKISGTWELASVSYNSSDIHKTNMKIINFKRPLLKIEGNSLKLLRNLRALETMLGYDNETEVKRSYFNRQLQTVEKEEKVLLKNGTNTYLEISVTFTNKQLGTLWWMFGVKREGNTGVLTIKSGALSDLVLKMHTIARGSFLAISKFVADKRKNDEKAIEINYTNQVNPLLSYFNLIATDQIKKDLMFRHSFFGVLNRGKDSEKFILYNHNPDDFNTTGYEIHNKNIIQTHERSLFVDGRRYYIFNETIAIIQGRTNLWFMDITNQNSNKIKEMMFERGQCNEFMLVRHSKMDVTFWCHSKSTLQAYYARELLSGKVGLSKIPVEYDKNIPFDKFQFEYVDFFQDFFYCLDQDFNLYIFKIEARLFLNVIMVKKVNLNLKKPGAIDIILDFKFVEDKLVIYVQEKIGWDSRIKFHFYHFDSAIDLKFMKTVNLDYNFSPDMKDTQLYRFETTRTNIYKERYLFMPLLGVKIRYNILYENVIFVNPNLEFLQSIPSVMFPMSSKLKVNLGAMITTSSNLLSYSFVVAYHNYSKSAINPKDIQISVIEPEELKLRLFEGKSTDIFDIYSDLESLKAKEIYFEQFNSTDENLRSNGLMLKVLHPSDLGEESNRLVKFKQNKTDLNLNDYKYSKSVEDHKPIEHKIEVFNLLEGHSFRFDLKTESPLEKLSKVIRLERLVDEIPSTLPQDFSSITPKIVQGSCSEPLSLEMDSLFKNSSIENKKLAYVPPDEKILYDNNLLIETFQIWICSSNPFPILYVRKLWRNMTLQTLEFRNVIGSIFSNDFSNLILEYNNHILSVNVLTDSRERRIYNDIYFLDIFSILNKTVIEEMKVTEEGIKQEDSESWKIKKINEKIEEMCFNDHMDAERPEEKVKRISDCKLTHKDSVEYKIQILHLKRENFRLDQSESLIKASFADSEIPDEEDPNKKITRTILQIDFVVFGLKKNIYSEYILEMNLDKIKVDFLAKKQLRKFIELKVQTILFTINKNDFKDVSFSTYDDIKYKFFHQENRDIWMIFENPSATNLIIRYPPSILKETNNSEKKKSSATKPFIWKMENPYFGKVSGANIVSKVRDWLYILPKIVSDEAHFIIYIIPKEKLIKYQDQKSHQDAEKIYSKDIFASTILVLKNVVDYKIKNMDFSQRISNFFILKIKNRFGRTER